MFPHNLILMKKVFQLNRGSFLKNLYFSFIVKWFYQTELRGHYLYKLSCSRQNYCRLWISKSRRRKKRHNVNFKKWGLDRRLDCFPALVSMSFIWIFKYFCTSFIDNAWVSIAINIYDLQVLSTFLFRSRKCFEFTFIDNKIMFIVSPLFSL